MAVKWKDAFHRAVARKDPGAMREAIAAKLPINKHVLASFGDGDEFTPLLYAIDKGAGAAVVGVLLDAGADVNARAVKRGEQRETALMLAAREGDVSLVQKLLGAGADVNFTDKYDSTALSWATFEKTPAHAAVMRVLLDAGAKPNYQALIGAARTGSVAMIDMLVKAGADVNEVSRWGTALVGATHEKRFDTVEALLRAGADAHLRLPETHRNYPGQTALEVAKKEKASKVIALLEATLAGKKLVTAPPPLEEVSASWKRIAKAAPAIKKSLKKGATEKQIAACEAALGVTFPPDLRTVYRAHNGQKPDADCFFPEGFADLHGDFLLLPLDQVVTDWQTWKKLLDGGEFKKQKSHPDAGVRADWWNPKWVPFASDGGGDSLCVDLAPAKGGSVGQVILHRHDDSPRPKLAPSIQHLLMMLAEHLEEE